MPRHKKFSSIGNIVNPREPYITKIRTIKKIIFHCTATPTGRDVTAADIDRMHKDRWGANSGCGYHYIITVDGKVEKGRWSDSNGSHAGPDKRLRRESSNQETIAVVYAGGTDKKLVALEEGMNPRQQLTAAILLSTLAREYKIETKDVLGHNELPLVNKGCPCTNMNNLRKRISSVNDKIH